VELQQAIKRFIWFCNSSNLELENGKGQFERTTKLHVNVGTIGHAVTTANHADRSDHRLAAVRRRSQRLRPN
jgi:hypothetical protein